MCAVRKDEYRSCDHENTRRGLLDQIKDPLKDLRLGGRGLNASLRPLYLLSVPCVNIIFLSAGREWRAL